MDHTPDRFDMAHLDGDMARRGELQGVYRWVLDGAPANALVDALAAQLAAWQLVGDIARRDLRRRKISDERTVDAAHRLVEADTALRVLHAVAAQVPSAAERLATMHMEDQFPD